MKPLEQSDILERPTYEAIRDDYRARVIEHKRARRLSVGDRVTLVFEDRETVRYQIQEMTRIEQIDEPAKVQHEIDVYNALLPGPNELSATLFIEIPELDRVRAELDRLLGIDECVKLEIGAGESSESVQATFDDEQMEEDRISAVHYVRFALTPEQVERIATGDSMALTIDHANYQARAPIDDSSRASLLRDLRDEAPEVMDLEAARSFAPAAAEPLYEDETLRVIVPATRERAHHYIVEPTASASTFGELPEATANALFDRARLVAAELSKDGIATRIVCELDLKGEKPVCIQVVSTER